MFTLADLRILLRDIGAFARQLATSQRPSETWPANLAKLDDLNARLLAAAMADHNDPNTGMLFRAALGVHWLLVERDIEGAVRRGYVAPSLRQQLANSLATISNCAARLADDPRFGAQVPNHDVMSKTDLETAMCHIHDGVAAELRNLGAARGYSLVHERRIPIADHQHVTGMQYQALLGAGAYDLTRRIWDEPG